MWGKIVDKTKFPHQKRLFMEFRKFYRKLRRREITGEQKLKPTHFFKDIVWDKLPNRLWRIDTTLYPIQFESIINIEKIKHFKTSLSFYTT